ncbi:MAG: DmsC/YnfH family molybdoenzyme membrane anchor subunit [Hyphomicrobiales bacterium]
MHPAYSVILFTVSSGAGYGLLALAGLVGTAHGKASSPAFALVTVGVALALITTGLLSSTAHLGRPERFWRAFSQWRSSWLSREGVAAVLTYPVALAFAAVWSGLVEATQWITPLGLLSTLMCAITVYCTSMIYAQLKTIPAWHSRYTVPVYLMFALATGSGLIDFISFGFGRFQTGAGKFMALLTLVFVFAVILLKWLYWRNLDRGTPQHTMAAATGLGAGVRQWEVPHTTRNFIMKEMGYAVGRTHARKLRRICMLLLDAAFVTALVSPLWPPIILLAAPLLLAAAAVERWLFFAEAEHVVQLYYGKPAV